MGAHVVFPEGKRAAVSLTFDDARLSQADLGLDLLGRCGVRATFYVSPQNVEPRLNAWRAAVVAGHEIGNHTMTHPCTGNSPWSRHKAIEEMTLEQMEREFADADAAIEQLLGVKTTTFAYPCGQTFVGRGRSLESYIPLVAKHFIAGRLFRTEVINDPEFCDLANLCANDSDGKSFEEMKGWVDTAIEQGRWLVIAGHEINESGRQTTIAPALDALCRYCNEREDVWIDTVANVATRLIHVREAQGETACIA